MSASVERVAGTRRASHLALLLLGVAARLLLSPLLSDLLSERVEFSVGRSRPKALQEAAWWLAHSSHSPAIAGSSTVQSAAPLFLLFSPLISLLTSSLPPLAHQWLTHVAFTLLDILVAWNLYSFALLTTLPFSPSPSPLPLPSPPSFPPVPHPSPSPSSSLPTLLAAAYFLNPLTLLSCVSHSLILFNHVLLTTALHRATLGGVLTSTAAVVALACIDRSYLLLIPSILLLLTSSRTFPSSPSPSPSPPSSPFPTLLLSLLALLTWSSLFFLLLLPLYSSPLSLLHSVFHLTTSTDLTPNLSLFWYLWTHMFTRFRPFFFAVLSLLPLPLTLPFSLIPPFTHYPHLSATLACITLHSLQQQLTAGSVALHLALLLWAGCLARSSVQRVYLPLLVLCVAGVLLPWMWFLWMGPGSGNANFYYFQTLLLNAAAIFCLVDVVKATRQLHAKLRSSTHAHAS